MADQQASEALYECPEFSVNEKGFGPCSVLQQFEDLPFGLFSPEDNLGMIVDITQPSIAAKHGASSGDGDDGSFTVVDSTRTFNMHKTKILHTKTARYNNNNNNNNNNNWNQNKGNKKKSSSVNQRRNYDILHVPSIHVKPTWTSIPNGQCDFSDLAQLTTKVLPTVTDFAECGSYEEYNSAFDRIQVQKPMGLPSQEKSGELSFVSVLRDPFMEQLAANNAANVYTTDVALAHLLVATRSQLSWDLEVVKNSKGIFFSHRPGVFDKYTVNETTTDLPTEDENKDDCLRKEVTSVNRDFAKIAMNGNVTEGKFPTPFPPSETCENPLRRMYRYRKFTLEDGTTMMVRTEVHGKQVRNGKTNLLHLYAINEWCDRTPVVNRWRTKLINTSGYALTEDMRNNFFRLSKWGVQAMLAGVDAVKIGLVSRRSMKDAEMGHVLLGVQNYSLDIFTRQLMLNEKNMWATLEHFVKLVNKQEDGHYIFLKDPMKGIIRMYRVPDDEVEAMEANQESEYDSEYESSEYEYSSYSESEYEDEEEEDDE